MRRAVLCVFAFGLVLASVRGEEPKPGTPREIDLKGYTAKVEGRLAAPLKITSSEGLAKAFPDKEWQKKIAAQVDFKAEYLLYFAWAGSGGDKLTLTTDKAEKGPAVGFIYRAGLTDDIRQHHRLFAVPSDARVTLPK